MDPSALLPYAPHVVALAVGLSIGGAAGLLTGRSRRRDLQGESDARALALLGARAERARAEACAEAGLGQQARRESLLGEAQVRVRACEGEISRLRAVLALQQRRHVQETAKLRTSALVARRLARRATTLARRAASELRRFEGTSLPATASVRTACGTVVLDAVDGATLVSSAAIAAATGALVTQVPRFRDDDDARIVATIDRRGAEFGRDRARQVTERDFAAFARLESSNEPQAPDDGVSRTPEGIDPVLERRLGAMGIRCVERFADLADGEADALGPRPDRAGERVIDFQGGAREAKHLPDA